MIRMVQRRLIIPRGDTGSFSIPYLKKINQGDVAVFTIFDVMTHTKLFQKVVAAEGDVLNIAFSHNETVNLQPGKYLWDIKIYTNPQFVDDELVNGEEIDSYYAGFSLPECEIRETGDSLLMSDDTPQAKLAPDQIDLISAAITATQTAKEVAMNSATDAETSASAAASSAQVALDSKDAALASQTSAATSESNAAESATAAQVSATQAAQIAQQIHEEIPTKVSDLVDDSGHYIKPVTGIPASDLEETYLTSFTEEDPTVPEWAKQPQKPTYTAQEVGALPDDTYIPSKTSDLVNDSDYAVDANYIHTDNNYTTAEKNKLEGIAAGAEVNVNADWNAVDGDAFILNKPTKVSDFTNDAGYLTEHQDISGKANSADLAAVATSGSYEDLSDKPTIPEVPVQDVQVNGASVLDENGIASIPTAANNVFGVVKIRGMEGVMASSGTLVLSVPSTVEVKMGNNAKKAIFPYNQHASTFYGLAKAAGDTTQSQSDNAVGAYTDSAKTAIQNMLGVPAASAIPTLVSQLTNDSGYLTSFTETDPTVPSWAKAAQKPTYTAAEVGAPTVQEMNTAIGNAIGNINSFDMAVVQALPTQDISTHTIYLVPKTGETNDVYDEYVYINNAWEMVGNTQIDLSNYVQKTDYATSNAVGLVKVGNGLYNSSDGAIHINAAPERIIKLGTGSTAPIVSSNQHQATFYGLAKAAGDGTQSQSANALGTYTPEAKGAIQKMLGVSDLIATEENNLIASKAYKVGDVFTANGKLYKATATIAADAAIIPAVEGEEITGANCEETSVGEGFVKFTDVANSTTPGVVRINGYGLSIGTTGNIKDMLYLSYAGEQAVKLGISYYNPIVPHFQDHSVFYGLSKAAGVDLANETVTVGTYPETSKAAIRTMLGATSSNVIAVQDTQPTDTDTKIWLPETTETPVEVPTVAEMNAALAGKVGDVTVNGTSIVSDGVADIPYATNSTLGLVQGSGSNGVKIGANGILSIDGVTSAMIKTGTDSGHPITANHGYEIAFYGLAKAAGDTTQSASDNAVGVYTEDAKAAIKNMLGIASGVPNPATKAAGDFLVYNGTEWVAQTLATWQGGNY